MTVQRVFAAGGLSSLTDLNARLIAQAVTTTEDEATESENDILDVGGARPEDPEADEDEEGDVEVRGRFSVEDPLEYNRVKEWIESNVFGGTSQGQAGLINSFVNEWDVEYRRRQGWGPEENIGEGATLETLLEDDEFVNGATWLPVTGTNRLPPLFTTSLPAQGEPEVDPETGEPLEGAEGEEQAPQTWVATADPLTGVTFRTIEEVAGRASVDALKAYREITVRNPTSPVAQELRREAFSTVTDGSTTESVNVGHPGGPISRITRRVRGEDDGPARPGGTLGPEAPGGVGVGGPMVIRESERPETREIPHFDQDELQSIINPPPASTGSSGSGTTRREIQFDKAHLTSQVAELYNRWMLEPGEAPESVVNNIVNRYVREARSLWSGKGVKKDFDTFVRGELKKLPRYETIYQHKLPGQSEEEFIGSFGQPIARLGLRNDVARRQTEAAVTSGGGPSDQLRRVSRTREAQVANAGNLSQRLARTLQGVGVG